jgi:hypothetical protein
LKENQMKARRSPAHHRIFALKIFAVMAALGSILAPCYAGLYDSDATSIKSGPILDRDYWRAKWDSMRLEDA